MRLSEFTYPQRLLVYENYSTSILLDFRRRPRPFRAAYVSRIFYQRWADGPAFFGA